MNDMVLCVVPTVPVWKKGDILIFDQKFFDGITQYAKYWKGSVSILIRLSYGLVPDFGKVFLRREDLDFQCNLLEPDEPFQASHFADVSLILAGGDSGNQLRLGVIAREAGAKLVFIIEYIPETRYQIVKLNTNNLVLRLRRSFYIWNEERDRRRAFQLADGIQSNGMPAFREYSGFSRNLLYYDTRVSCNQYISDDCLAKRIEFLNEGHPLRLAFSGRVIKMKGADHLVKLAVILKQRRVDYQMEIFGTGDLDGYIRDELDRENLKTKVILRGVVDFSRILVPELKNNCDLFVALHRQSDPSCTYLETLSCGVPLIGYANRMFQGLLDEADVGWGLPMNNVNAVADKIEKLNKNRIEIGKKAVNGLIFARKHTFEKTMLSRISHMKDIVGINEESIFD